MAAIARRNCSWRDDISKCAELNTPHIHTHTHTFSTAPCSGTALLCFWGNLRTAGGREICLSPPGMALQSSRSYLPAGILCWNLRMVAGESSPSSLRRSREAVSPSFSFLCPHCGAWVLPPCLNCAGYRKETERDLG